MGLIFDYESAFGQIGSIALGVYLLFFDMSFFLQRVARRRNYYFGMGT